MTHTPRTEPRRTAILGALLASWGCGDGGFAGRVIEAERGEAHLGGQVVATVNGHAVTLDAVQSLAARADLSPKEALARLEAERLLMEEAERRGYLRDARALEVRDKALVQRLLEQEEATTKVAEREIVEAYEAAKDRFVRPERRQSMHVLVRVEKNAPPARDAAARALASRIRRELEASTDRKATVLAFAGQARDGFQLTGEELPAVDAGASFVKPYLDALFGAEKPGVLPTVTRTSFGYHAIVVLSIEPAQVTRLADARSELEAQLLESKRREHVEEMLVELRAEAGVQPVPEAAERMASFELF